MNLVSLLDDRARDCPERLALVEGFGRKRRAMTFGELASRTRAGAAALRASGIKKGEVILFLHTVSLELYAALLSAMRMGAVPMLVDPGAGLSGVRAAVRRVPPRAWSGHGRGWLAKWLLPSLWRLPRARDGGAGKGGSGEDLCPVDEGDPALVTFTSGSTGLPKAAARSHGFLLAQNHALGRSLALLPGEVDLVTLPVFALANLARGVTSVLAAEGGAAVGEQMGREGVTRCAASPACLQRWLDEGVSFAGMTKLFTGGGPVFPRLLQRLEGAAPGAEVAAVYGSTEAEPIAHLASREVDGSDLEAMRSGAGLLAGHPVEEIRAAIIPDQWGRPIPPLSAEEFAAACRQPGEPGEIVVSGPHVLAGYLDGAGDEESKFRAGGETWHRTGDAGYLDALGRLWLLGRCGAVIRGSRGDLFPFALETMLSFDERVRRSAVVNWEGRNLLLLEQDEPAAPGRELPPGIDEIRRMRRLPVDRRHGAKIDYPELKRRLARTSGG